MENKQTAVEWLIDNLHYMYSTKWEDIIEEAKQIEKEQIMIAYMVCDDCGTVEESVEYAEQYYNKTYGK